MRQINKNVKCPLCNKDLVLAPKASDESKLVAICNCNGKVKNVIELDNPNFISLSDRLEPAEPERPAFKRSK